MPSYTSIGKYFSRIYSEQGAAAFWRVNFTNCDASLQFVLQGFGQVNVPKVRPEAEFRHVLLCEHASYGLAAAGSLTIVYPLDYARKRLSSDVGSGNQTFEGLFDFYKTAAGLESFFSLYAGFSRVHRRSHPVPWLPARCLRHHRGTQAVKERHRHDYFASTFVAAQTTMRLQVQAEKPVVQHIYKGTADCLKNIVAKETLPPASTKSCC